MSTVLSVRDLCKSYSGRNVVDCVSIDVRAGQITGFLGPNGAGKTTFMNIVAGLVKPDRGTVNLLDHRDGPSSRVTRARIGFLQEKPCIYPEMRLSSYLKFFATLYGVEDAAGRCREVLRLVGLNGHEQQQLGSFSRGMQQRACLARVLLHRPEFLILDEPTLGLDPIGVIDMREIFLGLRDQGVTILFSSHQLAEMERVCDHIILMYQGRVCAAGSRHEVLGQSGSELRFSVETFEPASAIVDRLRNRHDGVDVTVAGEHGLLVTVRSQSANEDMRRVRASISGYVADAGATVLSVEPDVKSLEDLFVRLAGHRRQFAMTPSVKIKEVTSDESRI